MGQYQKFIKDKMEDFSKLENTVFIGYNLKFGSKCYGTMSDVPSHKIIETPVCEGLMTGMATGMSLNGHLPVLIFERHDFMLIATDQIINHLDKISRLSEGQFTPKVIIRAIVGHDKPFDPGIQHKNNFINLFKEYCSFPVYDCQDQTELERAYNAAIITSSPVMITEYKKLY